VLGAEKTLEMINRMPKFDAIFITPDGRVLYSRGLEPPPARSTPPKSP
jgi:thiamine biosynthesis lipoprotein ApbE